MISAAVVCLRQQEALTVLHVLACLRVAMLYMVSTFGLYTGGGLAKKKIDMHESHSGPSPATHPTQYVVDVHQGPEEKKKRQKEDGKKRRRAAECAGGASSCPCCGWMRCREGDGSGQVGYGNNRECRDGQP